MSYLERRANLWYAVLTVPQDAREHIGKAKFVKSLGTADKREATLLLFPIIGLWKAQIKEARGQKDAVASEAARWKELLLSADSEVVQDVLDEQLRDKAVEMEHAHGTEKAQEFFEIAQGKRTPSNTYLEPWKSQLSVAAKTQDQFIKDVDLLCEKFSSLEAITRQSVKEWIDTITSKGNSLNTVNRILTGCRNYWKYLQEHDVISISNEPFKSVVPASKIKRNKSKSGWIPFNNDEIPKLWEGANSLKDYQLADLILLGAFTGARIEELCSIKLEDITDNSFKIIDAKTHAGIREVPIHSQLVEVLNRLKTNSQDGYLISGLTLSKYDDRSNAIGKRFGRLKQSMGYPAKKVFHSLRKTLVTQLENAGVPEGVTADIVGHEKQTMTYGLYSGGNNLETKRLAIEKVSYNFASHPSNSITLIDITS